eukprot:8495658-Prorocentrum_lima.AAC.1
MLNVVAAPPVCSVRPSMVEDLGTVIANELVHSRLLRVAKRVEKTGFPTVSSVEDFIAPEGLHVDAGQ